MVLKIKCILQDGDQHSEISKLFTDLKSLLPRGSKIFPKLPYPLHFLEINNAFHSAKIIDGNPNFKTSNFFFFCSVKVFEINDIFHFCQNPRRQPKFGKIQIL